MTEQVFGDGDKGYCSIHENGKGETRQQTSGYSGSTGLNKSLGSNLIPEVGLGKASSLSLNLCLAEVEMDSMIRVEAVTNETKGHSTGKLGKGEPRQQPKCKKRRKAYAASQTRSPFIFPAHHHPSLTPNGNDVHEEEVSPFQVLLASL